MELKSPKIVIRRVLESKNNKYSKQPQQLMSPSDSRQPIDMKPFYWECFTHSLIIIYGVVILMFTFYNPLAKA
jgi:hypothetical protein